MIKALEHLSTFASKADLNLYLPTYLLSLLSTKSVTEEFLVEEFQAFFICKSMRWERNSERVRKTRSGRGIIHFLPSPSHFSSFVAHPSLLLPIFSAHRRHACLLAPARSLRLQNGKETSATHAACHRIPDPYSLIMFLVQSKLARALERKLPRKELPPKDSQ